MPKHIALLRAVNVGGTGKIKMANLKALFDGLGFGDAQTLLQSGNVVFDGGKRKAAELEALLERETEKKLKLRAEYIVRTAAEWTKIVAANPFVRAANEDPSHLVIVFLENGPTKNAVGELKAAIKGRETVEVVGRELYAVYPDGIGKSKFTINLIEGKLGARGTGRNWNTVLKLAALMGS